MFDTCRIRTERASEIKRIADRIMANRERYEEVERDTRVPWHFIATLHLLESALDFTRHLHNGDPLTARTIHVPRGRPVAGNPPFTWRASAVDALRMQKLDQWRDWSIAGSLDRLERYNGLGYRRVGIPSPYLWSFSNHYTMGKFTADGVFSPTAVSQQCGGATLWRYMQDAGIIQLA